MNVWARSPCPPLQDLLALVHEYWNSSSHLLMHILKLLAELSNVLRDDFRAYLPELLPKFIALFSEAERSSQYTAVFPALQTLEVRPPKASHAARASPNLAVFAAALRLRCRSLRCLRPPGSRPRGGGAPAPGAASAGEPHLPAHQQHPLRCAPDRAAVHEVRAPLLLFAALLAGLRCAGSQRAHAAPS